MILNLTPVYFFKFHKRFICIDKTLINPSQVSYR